MLTLYLVDPWTPESQGKRLTKLCPPTEARRKVEALAVHYPGARVLPLLSEEAAGLVEDQSLDFAFIDARHNYSSVSKDIKAWLPKIRPGGWLGGHDFCEWRFPGVCEAVVEAFGDRVFTGADHCWFTKIEAAP